MKLILNPEFENLRSFVEKLPDHFDNEGEVIFKARNEIRKFTVNGVTFTVKGYKVPLLINRIAYTFFRPSKAERAYEYDGFLLKKGVDTPTPIAYIEISSGGLFHRSYFISEYVSYPRLMREFTGDDFQGRENILKAFAAFTARLHEQGILHLDFSPGNILFEEKGNNVSFSLVDLNRMRFGTLNAQQCLMNFNRISPSPVIVEYIVREYARLRKWDEDASVEAALREHKEFWYKLEKKNQAKKRFRSL